MLADAYRRSRHRLAAAYGELERAHEQSLRMHAQIERAGRLYAVNEVVAGVTHEMRNVLQGVFGHLWLVRRKLAAATPEVDEHLGQVEESCEHVMRIIRTTLDMARQPGDAAGPPARGPAPRLRAVLHDEGDRPRPRPRDLRRHRRALRRPHHRGQPARRRRRVPDRPARRLSEFSWLPARTPFLMASWWGGFPEKS